MCLIGHCPNENWIYSTSKDKEMSIHCLKAQMHDIFNNFLSVKEFQLEIEKLVSIMSGT